MFNKIKLIILSLACISQLTYADLIVTGDCDVSNATLTSIHLSDLDIDNNSGGQVGNNLLQNTPYNASECIGIFAGNDSDQTANNIGEFGDGLLNGEDSILTGYEFIDGMVGGLAGGYDGEPLNIDGLGAATDPGWINLAKFDVDDNEITYSNVTSFDQTKTLNISDVLKLTFSCDNSGGECSAINWTLTTDIDIAETVREVIDRATFDHLAFVAKAGSGKGKGNQDDKGWAIYDFNFYEIFNNEAPGLFDFETAYSLSGAINIKPGDFSAGLSHLTVWARDPLGTPTIVSEPTTLAIFAFGIIGLGVRRFKK
ncbi:MULTISPECIES: PEP-CTERM sorting domain-containing protein [unclassified Colwellia]|uniref:PEP-CTERM sorting domain-containing protein n=1 Tax=unclassified Colwellia TaxID=196834 RepID=UPI0015F5E225|nr:MULTISPECIES: PEP-CTERM sorting domain-containing protein [unclassified Colwellia]MBA6233340.1 PEP-CTERM sorting domain-containing protein [Colwellia sp. MB02u-7]MBA6236430.1 PEP-CTERM sorting domain-containing protein [Colwellia sp. MB02u-11]MBA6256964.1 PEP-CTERM sorting domain-containing protein [Colwellia sp. MB3u-28]MBA6261030.1 PEP-CTERM sorting domain-containing protein [Colwellia sp. MB3u-41]MBA6298170.1 PEP-CTERM sorting domain-containing protein [Colwellia sp. MB3u-22]